MKYHVYALSSTVRNYIYVGLTSDLERRLRDHQNGYNPTTKPYKPFELILLEEHETRVLAREREKYLKTSAGKRWLRSHKVTIKS